MLNNYIEKYRNCFNNFCTSIENLTERPKFKKGGFVLAVLVSFLLIYPLNIFQPLFGDDWGYSLSVDGHTRIQGISDIVQSLYIHYFDWGGRMTAHFIAELLLIFDTQISDVINSLIFVVFGLSIYFISNHSRNIQLSLFIGCNLLIWLFQPAFGSTILWLTGSANYLWCTLIIILFLTPYVKQVFTPTNKDNILKNVLFFIGGIIAGWTNENMAVALIVMLAAFIGFYKLYYGKIPAWAITGFVGAAIGAILMIAAPGNYARMDVVLNNQYHDQSFISIFTARILSTFAGYYYYALAPTFMFVIVLCLHASFGKQERKKQTIFTSALFMAGAVIATLAMIGSPIFPGRAAFGINSLIFVAIAILYSNLDFSTTLIKRVCYSAVIFAILFFIADYYRGYQALNKLHNQVNTRMEQLETGKKEGQKDFIFNDKICPPENKFLHYYDLTYSAEDWHNATFSTYYGINSIIIR